MAEARDPVVAVRAAPDADLSALTDQLWKERIPHRVIGDERMQLVVVVDDATAARVQALAGALARGDVVADTASVDKGRQARLRALRRFLVRTPVTAVVVALTLLLAPVAMGGEPLQLLAALYIVPPAWVSVGAEWTNLFAVLLRGEVWRLLTPCLLHFSLAHLAMDVVLFWALGRRIERGLGTWAALATFVLIGVASNVAQFVLVGNALFGGLSGVVMGQLGFLMLMARRSRDPVLYLPPAFAFGLLASSIVFATGITELVGLHIANTAHWAGFAGGVLLGAVWPVRRRPMP